MTVCAAMTLAAVLACGSASARDASPVRETNRKTTRALMPYTEMGLVVAVDAAKGNLSVKDKSGKVRKFAAMKAKIDAVEGRTLSLADISIGDEVSVSFKLSYKGRDAIEIMRLHKAPKR